MIECINVSKRYEIGGESLSVLDGVSLRIENAEWVAILGPSGAGKTTLLNILAGMTKPTNGTYRLNGRIASQNGVSDEDVIQDAQIGYMFQTPHLLTDRTNFSNIEMGIMYSVRSPKDRAKLVLDSARVTGVKRLHHFPGQLSEGERRLVSLTRAIAKRPPVLLLDEPTSGMDVAKAKQVVGVIDQMRLGGASIVMVTHDHDLASQADRIIRLEHGNLI